MLERLFGEKPRPDEAEQLGIQLRDTVKRLSEVKSEFDMVSDSGLTDALIYEIMTLQNRQNNIIKRLKELSL